MPKFIQCGGVDVVQQLLVFSVTRANFSFPICFKSPASALNLRVNVLGLVVIQCVFEGTVADSKSPRRQNTAPTISQVIFDRVAYSSKYNDLPSDRKEPIIGCKTQGPGTCWGPSGN